MKNAEGADRLLLSRRSEVEPFAVMDIVGRARELAVQGRDVVMLCVGEPSSPAAPEVLERAASALIEEPESLGYTAISGRPSTRAAIARWHSGRYQVDTKPENIHVTTGSSAALEQLLNVLLEPGDTLVVPRPGYPAYRSMAKLCGLELVEVECGAAENYNLSLPPLGKISLTGGGAVIVTSPHNPTGTVVSETELRAIAEWCTARGWWLISDEIYHGISYGAATATAWDMVAGNPRTVVVGSASKYFCMTGWRVGWAIAGEEVVRRLADVQGNVALCAPTLSQVALESAVAEGSSAYYEEVVDKYRGSRALMVDFLNEVGLAFAEPEGGFYLYVNIEPLGVPSGEFAVRLLEEYGVAVAPGTDFDTVAGDRWIRLSYCVDRQLVDSGCNRIRRMLAALHDGAEDAGIG